MSNVARELQLYRRYGQVFKERDRAFKSITAVHLVKQLESHLSSCLDFDLIVKHVLDLGSDNLFTRVRDLEHKDMEIKASHERQFAMFIHRLAELLQLNMNELKIPKEDYHRYILTESQRFYLGEFLSDLNNSLLEACKPVVEEVGS